MKQILKRAEPDGFRLWREANAEDIQRLINEGKTGDDLWNIFPSSLAREVVENDYSKAQLRQALLEEQFFICCYCNDEIKDDSNRTKVEHFLPKETFLDDTFNYGNLHLACNGGERESPVMLSCDSAKKDKNPNTKGILSPLLDNVHEHFQYRENGSIMGKTAIGITTVTELNLNCSRLQLRRKEAFEAYLYNEEQDIADLIAEVLTVQNGKHLPFCMAIVEVLKSYQ